MCAQVTTSVRQSLQFSLVEDSKGLLRISALKELRKRVDGDRKSRPTTSRSKRNLPTWSNQLLKITTFTKRKSPKGSPLRKKPTIFTTPGCQLETIMRLTIISLLLITVALHLAKCNFLTDFVRSIIQAGRVSSRRWRWPSAEGR